MVDSTQVVLDGSGPADVAQDVEGEVGQIAASEVVPTILETVRLATGMGFIAVVRVTDDRWVNCRSVDHIDFGLESGDELEVETTLCYEVRQADREIVIPDVRHDPDYHDHCAPDLYGFRSYVSVPIRRGDGSFFGTLCAFDPEPRDVADPDVIAMFRLFSKLIGDNLETEKRLQDSEALLARERDIGRLREEFLAILGHDLRNPVAAMRAGLRMLSRHSLQEDSANLVTHLRASAHRMSGLVENIVQHARMRLGSSIAIRLDEETGLGETLEHVVAEIEAVAPGWTFDVDIELDRPIRCDQARLGQLLSNLLANAIYHGDSHRPVVVRARTEDGHFEVSVENGGEPIPAATQAHLFEPFARGGGASLGDGMGLGLHIASQIAKGHGGRIDVRSDAARTIFTFRMPLGAV